MVIGYHSLPHIDEQGMGIINFIFTEYFSRDKSLQNHEQTYFAYNIISYYILGIA